MDAHKKIIFVDTNEFSFIYTMLAMMAYVGKNIMNLENKFPPVEIEPRTSYVVTSDMSISTTAKVNFKIP